MNPVMVLLLLPPSKAWEQEPAGSMARGCPELGDCGSWKKAVALEHRTGCSSSQHVLIRSDPANLAQVCELVPSPLVNRGGEGLLLHPSWKRLLLGCSCA